MRNPDAPWRLMPWMTTTIFRQRCRQMGLHGPSDWVRVFLPTVLLILLVVLISVML
jgi:hypothetical protein